MNAELAEVLTRVPEAALRRELDRRTGHRAFDAVARAWNVHPSALAKPSRHPVITQARHSLAAILRHDFQLTYERIAELLGISPSSPVKTIRKHDGRMTDADFRTRHEAAIHLLRTPTTKAKP